MNSPRVNLLNKNEQRYQGAVSRRFMLVSLVITPIMLVAVLSSIKLIQYSGVKSQLTSSEEIWEDLEPRLALYKAENQGLVANKKVMDLFDSWKESQGSFVQLLEEMQETVPENVQFSRLSIRGSQVSAAYANPVDTTINYELVIEGISQGERAENQVIDFRKELLTGERMASTFSDIKLSSLRKRSGKEGMNMREFQLKGESPVGGEK